MNLRREAQARRKIEPADTTEQIGIWHCESEASRKVAQLATTGSEPHEHE
jgi:hypothetical protein